MNATALAHVFGPLDANQIQIELDRIICARSFSAFVKRAWHVLEPPTQPLIWGWAMQAICDHLQAVTEGVIRRLLINVPPGMSKSMLTGVFWQAWEWGPLGRPYIRVIAASYQLQIAERDAIKLKRLVRSKWYQDRWGEGAPEPAPGVRDRRVFIGDIDRNDNFNTTQTGFRLAKPSTSLTGERGDRLIFDDPHSVETAESETERGKVTRTFRESVQTRLNNPDVSAIVVIMQRLHEDDVSGLILEQDMGYEHLMLPMRFEADRKCVTCIFEDPRTEDGELLFPERFSPKAVDELEHNMTVFAVAGQLQQRPEPRGGGIIKRAYWRVWDDAAAEREGYSAKAFPKLDVTVVSVDTAYTEKEENDPSACTVWGLWRDRRSMPRLMLMYGWADRLELNALLEKIELTCKRYHATTLLIEAKASGISVAQEIRRRNADAPWATRLIDPKNKDKVARAYAIQGIFENGMVYTPDRVWADRVISQAATFPKGKHDDLVDTTTQAIGWMRDTGMLTIDAEVKAAIEEMKKHRSVEKPLYAA